MVLTSPTCPFAGQVIDQVRRAVLALPCVEHVEVTLLDEPWRWERSEPHTRLVADIAQDAASRARIDT